MFLRERGILKRLRGTPLPSSAYLAGIAANAVTNTVLQVAVVIVAGRAFFGIPWPGDWFALLVFLAAGVVCFASLGVALSHAIPNSESAPAYVNAVFLPDDHAGRRLLRRRGRAGGAARPRRGDAAQAPDRRAVGRDGQRRGARRHMVALVALGLWAAVGVVLAVRGFSWEARRD